MRSGLCGTSVWLSIASMVPKNSCIMESMKLSSCTHIALSQVPDMTSLEVVHTDITTDPVYTGATASKHTYSPKKNI
jgi:hypothetical protein